jgi:hypothetical protein
MAGLMVENRRDLDLRQAAGSGPLEDVVSLIGIEDAELVAEHRLVIGEERQAADAIIDDVDLAAKVRIPDEAPVVNPGQELAREMKHGARNELDLS